MFPEAVVQEIRRHAGEGEETGTLAPEVLDRIYDIGLFKLFVPEALGGRMASLPDGLRIIERVAWVDGAFGWSVAIGAGGGYFVNFMAPNVLERVFGERNAVIAGSGYPGGIARPVPGGYRVSGRWRYCSGALYATTFTASARIDATDGATAPHVLAFAFSPAQVRIIQDWRAFGLKRTGSHTIQVDDAFVPDDFVFDLSHSLDTYDDPIYRYPFVSFAETSFASVVIGIGKHFLDEARVSAIRRVEGTGLGAETSPYRAAPHEIERPRRHLERSGEAFFEIVERSWHETVASGGLSDERRHEVSRSSKAVAADAVACASAVFPYLGMAAIVEDTALNRIYRDLLTARQHVMLVP